MLTKDQVNEKFGDFKLKFTNYYKYTFYFEGKADNYIIRTSYGAGDGYNIYKYDVDTSPTSFCELDLWYSCEIWDGDDLIFDWSDNGY